MVARATSSTIVGVEVFATVAGSRRSRRLRSNRLETSAPLAARRSRRLSSNRLKTPSTRPLT
jgi:hypothetical protein